MALTVEVMVMAARRGTTRGMSDGGGDANSADHTASDVTAVTQVPDLTLTKTHVGTFTQGQAGATYTLTARNARAGAHTAELPAPKPLPCRLPPKKKKGAGGESAAAAPTRTPRDAVAPRA